MTKQNSKLVIFVNGNLPPGQCMPAAYRDYFRPILFASGRIHSEGPLSS